MNHDTTERKVLDESGIGFLNLLQQDFADSFLGKKIRNTLLSTGMSTKEFQALRENKEVLEKSVQSFTATFFNSFQPSIDLMTGFFRFCIDCDTNAESVKRIGKTYVTDKRVFEGKKIITADVVELSEDLTSEDIRFCLERKGFWLSRVHELVTFQKAFPVVRDVYVDEIFALGEYVIPAGGQTDDRTYFFEDVNASLKCITLGKDACFLKGTKFLAIQQ